MMTDTPAVLMILESVFPSLGGGGAESQVRTLALELMRRSQPLELWVPMVAGGSQLRHERVDGIPVTRIAYPKVPLFGAVWLLLRLAWLLFAKRHQYAVIHAHIAGNMAAVACLMGRQLRKPVLVKLTGMTEIRGGILDPQPRSGARVRRWAMRRASAYQATSQRLGGLLVDAGFQKAKILSLPNAVDTSRFEGASQGSRQRRLALCGERQLVGIFVGRLEAEKGLDLLIEAWAQSFAQRADVALLLVGGGRLLEPLKAQAHARGIGGQVVFAGPQDRVEDFLPLADFGLLTSQFEGLSNSLLEYMAASLPVVGSKVSGTEDWVVDGHTGWLFPPGDVPALVHALRAVGACTPEELSRRGRVARDWVVRSASIPAVVQGLQTTYQQLEADCD